MQVRQARFAILLALLQHCQCLPEGRTSDQVNAAVNAGTFESPSVNVRPRFRYWIPDASVNHTRVALDIEDAGRVGMGGVEVLGYYSYDSLPGEYIPVDWATYGWGTQAWRDLLVTAAEAHRDCGLVMDAALGPNQGAGVPALADSEGLQWDLVQNVIKINGSAFDGVVPGWGIGVLQAAIVGSISASENTTGPVPGLPGAAPSSYNGYRIQNTLATDSLKDITDQVGRKDQAREQQSPEVLDGPQTLPQNYRQNGSWIVDHFSALGAQTTIQFWEQYLLDNQTSTLLSEVGNCLWEHSVEISPTVYWTRYLPEAFEASRGYPIFQWLPLIFHQSTLASYTGVQAGVTWYITDEEDSGNKHIGDYRQTLGELYGEYLSTYTAWAESLGLQFSAQVAYNIAQDMAQNIPKVNVPECESLASDHLIDSYRQYAGPANLAGKRVISSELGANPSDVYHQTLPELLWDITQSLAGGVNQFVLHGYPYSGTYPNTTWPGFTTFQYVFSEMHGRHQPGWDFYSDSMDFIARNQHIFQSGVPKVDVAFYNKLTTYATIETLYTPTDLNKAGYTYEYISPDNFNLPEAYVGGNILAPERQASKAMVVRANDSLTVECVTKLAEYAYDGLTILFSGGVPSYLVSFNFSGETYVNETLHSLLLLDHVHLVPYEGLAASLSDLEILPKTQIDADSIWYTYWRRDDAHEVDYVFIYHDGLGWEAGACSTGTVRFACTGTPYIYSAWTGAQTPATNYTQTETATSMYFELAGNQSVIVAFHDRARFEHSYGRGNTFRQPQQEAARHQPLTLGPWSLIVEHWDPPRNLYDVDTVAVKHNTTHQLCHLTAWLNIPGLENVSGRGYYNTTFEWSRPGTIHNNRPDSASGAIIDFGPIVHTIRVAINGHTLPPLDLTWARADISMYLVEGVNTVEAVVSTPLYNRLKPIAGKLRTFGQGWSDLTAESEEIVLRTSPLQEYGL